LLLFLLVSVFELQAQNNQGNLELIKKQTAEIQNDHGHRHDNTFLLSGHPSVLVRYNPVRFLFGSLMWTYQKYISPQFSSKCIYHPSCSAYSKNLIAEFGIVRGIILTADRLSRCNRLALMDFNSWEADPKIGKIRETTDYYRIDE